MVVVLVSAESSVTRFSSGSKWHRLRFWKSGNRSGNRSGSGSGTSSSQSLGPTFFFWATVLVMRRVEVEVEMEVEVGGTGFHRVPISGGQRNRHANPPIETFPVIESIDRQRPPVTAPPSIDIGAPAVFERPFQNGRRRRRRRRRRRKAANEMKWKAEQSKAKGGTEKN